ncbi:stage III sporulation protein AA [Thalassobacillus pellis]|uniref:stage III sporulation protein AA n=1 Tax=Thalassobacillus pellis TaxID=748008 RepID=UPI0019602F2C|nr:stage III sporulation protein AA [Thalassobacillus pellis]MBM7552326.1 stage III sporulation protein AA [Thalassobacillus pellis]
MNEIINLFPENIQLIIRKMVKWNEIQEIRLRVGQPIELIYQNNFEWLDKTLVTEQEKNHILNQISQFSLYRLEDELREGFITIEGGHRIGLSGKVNTTDGDIHAIRHISSFNIRIAREKKGIASSLMYGLLKNNRYLNTLIIGAPQTGKTTLLRDITRHISSGWGSMEAKKVAVIDERSEIGACIHGIPQLDVGRRTDVMDACPKSTGMMMMIRSMSPDVLVVDEIGHQRDVIAIHEAINAGVTLFCTVHGNSLEEIKKRPSIDQLLSNQVFDRYLLLQPRSSGKAFKKSSLLNGEGYPIEVTSGGISNEMDRGDIITRGNYLGRL